MWGILMGVMPERERAADKARKVFQHGASTTARGEKEKAVAVLITLCRKHRLVLHDLDPQFPARLDVALLRVKIGLAQTMPSASGPDHGQQRPPGSGARTGTQRPQGQRQTSAGGAGHQGAATGADPREVLFQAMGAAERGRWLQGPMFSQGIRRGLQNTGADGRLLAEVRSLNTSNVGVNLNEPELMRWFEAVLSRPGSSVPCKSSSRTIFDDLAAYCRAQYLAETERRRQAAQRRRAEEDRRRAEEARAERERRAAEQRRKAAEERRAGEREVTGAQPDPGRTPESPYGVVAFSRVFEYPAEAQLYLKVARRWVGPEANLRASTRQGRCSVEFTGSPVVRAAVESAYAHALHDLQLAAATIRTEAARRRDEAVRRAEATYTQQCEKAFQDAVDSYTA